MINDLPFTFVQLCGLASAFVGGADGLMVDGAADVLPAGQYILHHADVPVIGALGQLKVGLTLRTIVGGLLHPPIMQKTGDFAGALALQSKLKDAPDYRRRFLVNEPVLRVVRVFPVAIPTDGAGMLTGNALGFPRSLHALTEVFDVPFVDQIHNWGKLAGGLVNAVHTAVNGNKADIVLRENYLGVEADLQIVAPDPAHVLGDNSSDFVGFHILYETVSRRTVEGSAAVPIVRVVNWIVEVLLSGIDFQTFLLVLDGAAFLAKTVLTGETLVQGCNFRCVVNLLSFYRLFPRSCS